MREETRIPFFVCLDEFHILTTTALARPLVELWNYRLGLVLAHQHAPQLERKVQDAPVGNDGTPIYPRWVKQRQGDAVPDLTRGSWSWNV